MRSLLALSLFGLLLAPSAGAQEGFNVPHFQLTIEPARPPTAWERITESLRARVVGILRPKPGTTYRVTAVAYSPTIAQNDRTPCLTAAGTIVQRGTVATNFLPLGTRLRVSTKEDSFGAVVLDRMNARYNGIRIIDIWHPTRQQALAFGKKTLHIEILGYIPRSELKREFSLAPAPTPAAGERQSLAPEKTTRLTSIRRLAQFFRQFLSARLSLYEDAHCVVPSRNPQKK